MPGLDIECGRLMGESTQPARIGVGKGDKFTWDLLA